MGAEFDVLHMLFLGVGTGMSMGMVPLRVRWGRAWAEAMAESQVFAPWRKGGQGVRIITSHFYERKQDAESDVKAQAEAKATAKD